jgi:hypothetical protein
MANILKLSLELAGKVSSPLVSVENINVDKT